MSWPIPLSIPSQPHPKLNIKLTPQFILMPSLPGVQCVVNQHYWYWCSPLPFYAAITTPNARSAADAPAVSYQRHIHILVGGIRVGMKQINPHNNQHGRLIFGLLPMLLLWPTHHSTPAFFCQLLNTHNNNNHLWHIEDCCDSYYQSTKTKCIVDGGGTPPTGTSKWYVGYENERCVADCPVRVSVYCGGYASPSDTLFGMALGLCYANIEGYPYMGSGNVYVDNQNNRCVRDCRTSGSGSAPDCVHCAAA
jgi:hypothetical protein